MNPLIYIIPDKLKSAFFSHTLGANVSPIRSDQKRFEIDRITAIADQPVKSFRCQTLIPIRTPDPVTGFQLRFHQWIMFCSFRHKAYAAYRLTGVLQNHCE